MGLCLSVRFVLCQEVDLLIRLLDITDTSHGAPCSLPRVTQEPSAKKGMEEDCTGGEAERHEKKTCLRKVRGKDDS